MVQKIPIPNHLGWMVRKKKTSLKSGYFNDQPQLGFHAGFFFIKTLLPKSRSPKLGPSNSRGNQLPQPNLPPPPLDVASGRACSGSIVGGGALKTGNDQAMDRSKLSPDLNHEPAIWDRKSPFFFGKKPDFCSNWEAPEWSNACSRRRSSVS